MDFLILYDKKIQKVNRTWKSTTRTGTFKIFVCLIKYVHFNISIISKKKLLGTKVPTVSNNAVKVINYIYEETAGCKMFKPM